MFAPDPKILFALVLWFTPLGAGVPLHEETPIRYWDRSPKDFTREWTRSLEEGSLEFDASSDRAFLESVLDELGIPTSSQVLVFSKTSFQVETIDPATPRALYFDENHYVGWVPGGDIEIATMDPRTGMNFYQVPLPEAGLSPQFIRNSACLGCHGPTPEMPFPRVMLFSVFADESGSQILRGTTHAVDHRTPIDKRWGGWFVTGTSSGPRHRGNFFSAPSPDLPEAIDESAGDQDLGAHRADLADVVDLEKYPAKTSDALALLILEHQTLAHNQIARAYGNSRIALWNDDAFFSGGKLKAETLRVIEDEVSGLLDVFLFKDEASLDPHRIEPSEDYRSDFLARARHGPEGRSLRDLALTDRMFVYRCSYMIHSEAFDYLPDEFKNVFFQRLAEILENGDPDYAYLSEKERDGIRDILLATCPGFADISDV